MKHKPRKENEDKTQHISSPDDQATNKTGYRGNPAPMPILGEKAEDYLREEANIEDLPDEQDERAYDQAIRKSSKRHG